MLALPDSPVLILPDLHTRTAFLASALAWRPEGQGPSMAELLERGEASMLCLGDIFHSEGELGSRSWKAALREYAGGWERSGAMDEEMGRALSCLELLLRAKEAFPRNFHCLKGNHDNIVNEDAHGDHGFYKFALEGEMASSWFGLRYGLELQAEYRCLELSLPLAARGRRFVASHAEPAFALSATDIVEYRSRPEVVEALIWTPNEGAEPGSVAASLSALLGAEAEGSRWFGGHRPVQGLFALRQEGRYVQFHNPERHVVAFIPPGGRPDPERVIRELP